MENNYACHSCKRCINLTGIVCKNSTIIKTKYCIKHYYNNYNVLDNVGSDDVLRSIYKFTNSRMHCMFYNN